MEIRKAMESDTQDILLVEKAAFGDEEGPEIVKLVNDLLCDQSAMPLISLIAVDKDQTIGHIMFTKARLTGASRAVSSVILAPLAVLPEAQAKGVGGRLIKKGLELALESNVELVFVLGHPGYYPRHGFKTAGTLGFEAPYSIPDEHADAWMVQELCTGVIGSVSGKVQCSDVLNKPEHWRE